MRLLICALMVVTAAGVAAGQSAETAPTSVDQCSPAEHKSWFDLCTGWRDELEQKHGTRCGALVNYTGQLLLNGERREGKGKSALSYGVEVNQGLWSGGMLVAIGRGGAGEGLDGVIPTLTGFNAAAGEPRCIYLSEFYLQQTLCDEAVTLAAGRLDLSMFFDLNAAANCEDTQFIAGALVNNPTIPFPDYGMGVVVRAQPLKWLAFQAGTGDAETVGTRTGLDSAFHSPDRWTNLFQVDLMPTFGELEGNYRVIFWHDYQTLDRIDFRGTKRDDMGFAISADQQISDRVTLFGRYGFAHEEAREIAHFWSVGGQLAEPLPGRCDDVLGVGVAQSITGRSFRLVEGAGASETVFETYYSIALKKYLTLSPHVQVVLNPGAQPANDVAVVAGIRVVAVF